MCSVIVKRRWCARVVALESARTAFSYESSDPISTFSWGFQHPVRLQSSLATVVVQLVNWYPLSSACRFASTRMVCQHVMHGSGVVFHCMRELLARERHAQMRRFRIHVMIGQVNTPRSCMGVSCIVSAASANKTSTPHLYGVLEIPDATSLPFCNSGRD